MHVDDDVREHAPMWAAYPSHCHPFGARSRASRQLVHRTMDRYGMRASVRCEKWLLGTR